MALEYEIEFKYKSKNFLVLDGDERTKFVLWINETYPKKIPIYLTRATEELVKS